MTTTPTQTALQWQSESLQKIHEILPPWLAQIFHQSKVVDLHCLYVAYDGETLELSGAAEALEVRGWKIPDKYPHPLKFLTFCMCETIPMRNAATTCPTWFKTLQSMAVAMIVVGWLIDLLETDINSLHPQTQIGSLLESHDAAIRKIELQWALTPQGIPAMMGNAACNIVFNAITEIANADKPTPVEPSRK